MLVILLQQQILGAGLLKEESYEELNVSLSNLLVRSIWNIAMATATFSRQPKTYQCWSAGIG